MLKIKLNILFIYLILGLVFITYLLPGLLQFILGIPSTVYTLGLTFIVYLIVFFDILIRKKIVVTKPILGFIILAVGIIISGIINKTSLLKILLYLNFALVPISMVYLNEIVTMRKLIIQKSLSQVFRFIVIIQLPILLFQRFGYDTIIKFKNANQDIANVDFMFGTFAIKADHALGFFLIAYLLHYIFRLRSGKIKGKKYYLMIIYIILTVMVMESNLTKVVLLLIIGYYFSLWIYSKIKVFGVFLIVITLFLLYKIAMTSHAIESQIEHLTETLNDRYALQAVKKGYAKRPHIVIYQLNHEEFKWVGNGPYDYYDITTGTFKNTIHFSQLIWFYNDIGIISLIIALMALLLFVKSLNLEKESSRVLIVIMLLYLFMTNVLGDLSMMLSLMLLNNRLDYN